MKLDTGNDDIKLKSFAPKDNPKLNLKLYTRGKSLGDCGFELLTSKLSSHQNKFEEQDTFLNLNVKEGLSSYIINIINWPWQM